MDETHDKVIFIDKTVAVSWGKLNKQFENVSQMSGQDALN